MPGRHSQWLQQNSHSGQTRQKGSKLKIIVIFDSKGHEVINLESVMWPQDCMLIKTMIKCVPEAGHCVGAQGIQLS